MLVIRTWRKQLTSAFEKGRLSGRQSRPREATVPSEWIPFRGVPTVQQIFDIRKRLGKKNDSPRNEVSRLSCRPYGRMILTLHVRLGWCR